MLKSGDRIGPYQLLNKLGSGTFGVVWKAKNVEARKAREVALKIPRDEDIDLNTIDAEAEIWIRASGHPNVLPFIEAGMYDDYVVIASEYAPDGSLQGWLNRHDGQAPSIEAAVEMTRGILAGLEHLHQQRIIHRDLKPDNILLQGETPRLADFGLSRVVKSTNRSVTLAGTPEYMAPEAFQRIRNEQTDVWSVSVMLYQMLSGKLPFEGDDVPTICVAVRDQELPPLPATVPPWLREIVMRSLSKDPGQRYRSANEMRRDLTEAKQRHEQVETARQRQEAEQQRALIEQQQRSKEAQLQAEREQLQRENTELQRRLLENQQRAEAERIEREQPRPEPPVIPAQQIPSALPPTLIDPPRQQRNRLLLVGGAVALALSLATGAYLLYPKNSGSPVSLPSPTPRPATLVPTATPTPTPTATPTPTPRTVVRDKQKPAAKTKKPDPDDCIFTGRCK